MKQIFEIKTLFGILIWIALIGSGIWGAREWFQHSPDAMTQVGTYVTQPRNTVDILLPSPLALSVGDLVYLADSQESSPIGAVSEVVSEPAGARADGWDETVDWLGWGEHDADNITREVYLTRHAKITFFGNAPELNVGYQLEYHASPDSLAWVIQTMLHEEKRKEIATLIMDSFQKNQAAVFDALSPVIKSAMKKASQQIREDMKAAFEKKEKRLREIGEHYQAEVVKKELLPLVKEEIWPVVQKEAEPLTKQVGQEIWSEVSLFRFGWRYLYDQSPLPGEDLTQREFKRFAESKAVPILEAHIEDFVEVQKSIIKKIAANKKVKTKLAASARQFTADPKVQEIFMEVMEEVFVDNDRLHRILRDSWQTPEAQSALQLTNARLEPTITEIGVALFGDPHKMITPEFARVLRHRIMQKDSRWLMLVKSAANQGNTNSLPVVVARTPSNVPMAPARSR